MSFEQRLKELGLVLPKPGPALGNYLPVAIEGSWLYTSGASPSPEGKLKYAGQVGLDLTVEEGYQAARLTGLVLLARIREELGSLDRVKRVWKVLGMVNCPPGFEQHPAVINGASDLFVEVFGEAGRHARSAVGMSSLPGNCAVEIEMLVKLKD